MNNYKSDIYGEEKQKKTKQTTLHILHLFFHML